MRAFGAATVATGHENAILVDLLEIVLRNSVISQHTATLYSDLTVQARQIHLEEAAFCHGRYPGSHSGHRNKKIFGSNTAWFTLEYKILI